MRVSNINYLIHVDIRYENFLSSWNYLCSSRGFDIVPRSTDWSLLQNLIKEYLHGLCFFIFDLIIPQIYILSFTIQKTLSLKP